MPDADVAVGGGCGGGGTSACGLSLKPKIFGV
jgi:hypothetical protein